VLNTTILLSAAAAFFTAGLLTLAFLFMRILRSARRTERERRYAASPWRSDLNRALAVVAALAAIGLANGTFWLNSQLRLYTPVSPNMPLGMVSVLKTEANLPRLVLSTLDDNGREIYEVFPVRDATFRVHGERIRWSQYLAPLGFDDFFKVTRVEFFPPTGSTVAMAPTFHADVRCGSTSLFVRLAGSASWLPFVEAEALSTPAYGTEGEFAVHMVLDSTGLALR